MKKRERKNKILLWILRIHIILSVSLGILLIAFIKVTAADVIVTCKPDIDFSQIEQIENEDILSVSDKEKTSLLTLKDDVSYGEAEKLLTGKVISMQKDNRYQANEEETETEVQSNDQYYLSKDMIEKAWEISEGSSTVTVAVIDTGITVKKNLRHEALKDVSDGGTVLYDSAYDAATSKLMKDENFSDFIGHGTKVSSVVSGMSKKITGISNGARILPINIYENIQTTDSGKYEKYTGYASTSSVIRAYQYILDHSDELNIRVINLSFGGNPTSDDEILQEYIDKAYKQGILSVASSGNNGTADYNYPASADHVISVGATDKDSQKCEFSQYNNKVDLVASGENILVSKGGILKDRETGSNFMYKTTSYSLATGTSFSAPIVAGTAAMMFAENPDLSCEDAEKILKDTASDLGMSGKDDLFGYGEVNAYQAVNASLLNKKITKESELKGSQRPSGIKLSSVKVKKYFAVTWKKVSGISGYQIQYSEKKSFKNGKTITVRNKNSVSKKILKNPVKRTYYIRIRTYKTVSGKKVCSGWSKPVVVRPGKK